MEQVHGHEVINVIKGLKGTESKEELITIVNSKFGEETLFYNCSNDSMSAEVLLTFFEGKGKLLFSNNGFVFGKPSECNH